MPETLKIAFNGRLGTCLRPHTLSKPKQLVTVAGKPVPDRPGYAVIFAEPEISNW
jgi:dTDP-glucose pyrophosphorylase